jgi:DNA-binding IclR family transcriptional regulator
MTNPNTSLRVQIAVWFALHPDDTLTSSDAATKFGMDRTQTYDSFRSLIRDGYVELIDGANPKEWRAGPKVLAMVWSTKGIAA